VGNDQNRPVLGRPRHQVGPLSREQPQLPDELSRPVDDDQLLGLVVSNDLDLTFENHVEIPPRLAGTVESISGCHLPAIPELSELFEDVRGERGKPLV